MPQSIEYSYQAFLSYSHADRKWGERLHRRLENYHVEEALVGRATSFGQVPARLIGKIKIPRPVGALFFTDDIGKGYANFVHIPKARVEFRMSAWG